MRPIGVSLGRSPFVGIVPNDSNSTPGNLTVEADGWYGPVSEDFGRLASFRRRDLVTQVSSWQTPVWDGPRMSLASVRPVRGHRPRLQGKRSADPPYKDRPDDSRVPGASPNCVIHSQ